MSDLVPITDPDQLAALPVEQRGLMITQALRESKSWLAVATKGTDPTPIAEFRAWAATVAEMTRQKGLAEEIQLDALEMVRRAERGIGVAIRNGQEAGEILRQGEIGNGRSVELQKQESYSKPGPAEAAGVEHPSGLTPLYDLTDGVSDEQFDAALDDAKTERDLSRANVTRKVRGEHGHLPVTRQLGRIRAMASQGYSSRQIAETIGSGGRKSDAHIREIARANGIEIPADAIVRGTHHIVPERVVRETIHGLEGYRDALKLLDPDDYNQLNPDDVRAWSSSLAESLRVLRELQRELNQHV